MTDDQLRIIADGADRIVAELAAELLPKPNRTITGGG